MRRLARHGAVVAAHTTTLRPVTGCVATLKSGASSGDAGEPQTDTRRAWGRSAACPKAAAQTGVRGWRGLANDASTSGRAEVRGDVRGDVSSFVARLRADVLALWRGAEMTEAFLGEELHGPKLLKMLKLLAEPEQGGDGDHDQQLLTVRAFPGSCSRRVGGQAPSLSVSTRVGADVWGRHAERLLVGGSQPVRDAHALDAVRAGHGARRAVAEGGGGGAAHAQPRPPRQRAGVVRRRRRVREGAHQRW
jgi:hypothetical protein